MSPKKFSKGQIVRIDRYTSGIYSGKVGIVVTPVDWRTITGMYQSPDLKKETCLYIPQTNSYTYMYNNRLELIKVEGEGAKLERIYAGEHSKELIISKLSVEDAMAICRDPRSEGNDREKGRWAFFWYHN